MYIYDRYVKHPKPDPITICFNIEYYCLNYNEFLLLSFFHLCCKKKSSKHCQSHFQTYPLSNKEVII